MAGADMASTPTDPDSGTPVPDSHSDSRVSSAAAPEFQHWGRLYAFVLAFLALLIALFAWLTHIYS